MNLNSTFTLTSTLALIETLSSGNEICMSFYVGALEQRALSFSEAQAQLGAEKGTMVSWLSIHQVTNLFLHIPGP